MMEKTKYYYRVVLDIDKAEQESDLNGMPLYVIYYRGKKMLIGNKQFEWREEEPITYEETLEVIKGTVGIKIISAIFKMN